MYDREYGLTRSFRDVQSDRSHVVSCVVGCFNGYFYNGKTDALAEISRDSVDIMVSGGNSPETQAGAVPERKAEYDFKRKPQNRYSQLLCGLVLQSNKRRVCVCQESDECASDKQD